MIRQIAENVQTVRQFFKDPDIFMERKVDEPNIKGELGILLLIGAAMIPGNSYLAQRILDAPQGGEEIQLTVIGLVLRPLLYVFILWIAYSIVLHVIAGHYRGRGPLRGLFKGTAWALIPAGLGNLVQSVAMYFVYRDMDIFENMQGRNPPARVESVLSAGMEDPILIVATLILLGTLLWSGYIMSFAVQHGKNISRDQALRTAAVPVGIHALFILWAIIQETTGMAIIL